MKEIVKKSKDQKDYYEDIIFARATPPGASAIAVVRVSGKNSWRIINKFFKPLKINKHYESHKIYYGSIDFDDQIVDNVLVSTFAEGRSFTGEESFEISCHGSEVIVSMIVKILLSLNLRIAEPGEFSKRAFLNNKMDLTEAESIMDLINSSTRQSALIAVKQLTGRLTNQINNIKERTAGLLTEIEVDIDYPEEELSIDYDKWTSKIAEIIDLIDFFLKSFKRGRFYRESIEAVIAGRTNSGKSTLFNFLLNEDKAIVSDIHGTTRDYLDGIINISGYGVRIYDTAGLRQSNDPIEIEGTKRSLDLINKNSIILYIISASDGMTEDDWNNLKNIGQDKKVLIIINKIDLNNDIKKIENMLFDLKLDFKNYHIVKMSALNKIGLDDFNSSFLKLLTESEIFENDDPLITNERHALLLSGAKKNLIRSREKLDEKLLDLTAFELREALNRLGEITGEITSDDIINRIFSSFCIGK
ncbi:MAG: tRNA uridine-5-carboxymethylaminomethyl(34) synthesis GTPase MnmE [Spirochaetes bacterium]|nr:tRNA uridine-5-carboxymethylaminomethyl(34) synthesis GTPase MnmE [Spirochaetota bacterium]